MRCTDEIQVNDIPYLIISLSLSYDLILMYHIFDFYIGRYSEILCHYYFSVHTSRVRKSSFLENACYKFCFFVKYWDPFY